MPADKKPLPFGTPNVRLNSMEKFQALRGQALLFLLFIWFLWFLSFTARTIFSPLLPLMEDEFRISHATAASLLTFIAFGYSLSLFLSGIFSGLLGLKKSIVLSMVGSSIIFFVIPFLSAFHWLRLLAFTLGLTTGIYLPSIIPLITEYYHEKIWGKTIAIHDSAASLSIFAAPFIALFSLRFFPWKGIFVVLGSLSFLCGVLFFFVCKEVKTNRGKRPFLSDLIRRKPLWIMGILWIFAAGANLGLYFVFPLYLTKELRMDVESANTIFGLSRLGGIVVSISAGFFVDRFSLKKITFFLVLTTGLLTIALTTRDLGWLKVLLFLHAGIAVGFFPVALVSISRVFNQDMRGQATGLIVTLGVIFGIGLIPYLLGLSGDLLSFRVGIFLLGALTCLSSGLVYYLRELG